MSLDLLNKPCVKKCSLRKQFCYLRLIGAKARLPVWHADVDGANRGPIWSDETLPRKTSWILFSKHTKTQKVRFCLILCAALRTQRPSHTITCRRAEQKYQAKRVLPMSFQSMFARTSRSCAALRISWNMVAKPGKAVF